MKDQFIERNIKQKLVTKNTTIEFRYFVQSNSVGVNRLFDLFYLIEDGSSKRFKTRKYYLPKDIIKSYIVIINGKNFSDQSIDSDIK